MIHLLFFSTIIFLSIFLVNLKSVVGEEEEVDFHKRGKDFLKEGDLEKALASFLIDVTRDKNAADSHFEIGNILVKLRNLNGALAYYTRAIEALPTNSTLYIGKANVLLKLKQHEAALNEYNDAIKQDPLNSDLYLNMGNIFKSMQKFEQAINEYYKAFVIGLDTKYYVPIGDSLFHLGKYRESVNAYRNITDPKGSNVYFGVGESLYALKEYEEAENAYRSAIKFDPENSKSYLKLAKSLYNQKTPEKYEEAENAYRSAIKFDPKNIEASLGIAASLFQREHYVEAENAYRNTTILDPENSNAYLGIAESLYELKEYEEALTMYKIVLDSDEIDNIGGIVINRAIELYTNEKIDNKLIALTYLNAVLESDYGKYYGDSNLYFIMGNSYFETENYENALNAYKESVMYDDTNSTVYFLKGKTYAELEEYKKAMKAYNKAIKLNPSAQELNDIKAAIDKIKPCLVANIPDYCIQNKEIKNNYEILQHT